jgi:hypothetical protein
MVEKSVGIWNLCGFLEWVERAGFFEPLAALNAENIAQEAEGTVYEAAND